MRLNAIGSVVVLAAALAPPLPIIAGESPAPPLAAADSVACELSLSEQAHPLSNREETLARYQQLPPGCLKALVLACNAAADKVLLDLGSAAVCSIGYEALLKRGFGGNFQALVAWWRSRNDAPSPH